MDLRQVTVYEHFAWVNNVDQSSSRGLEKFCEDIRTSPEVMMTIRWILGQILNFHDQEIFGEHPIPI